MCDYSLEAYRSRPAEAGEKLTLERFPSGSMGFTAGAVCDTAVCVPAGVPAQLACDFQNAIQIGMDRAILAFCRRLSQCLFDDVLGNDRLVAMRAVLRSHRLKVEAQGGSPTVFISVKSG